MPCFTWLYLANRINKIMELEEPEQYRRYGAIRTPDNTIFKVSVYYTVRPIAKDYAMIKILRALLVFICVLFSNHALSETIEKRYELPSHGSILLNVPAAWADHVKRPPGNLPPTIQFNQKEGEEFVILFTPLWKTENAQPDFGTPQSIKSMVEHAALEISSQTTEADIKIKELRNMNIGYYYSVTDKSSKPGEYKYMSQGAVGLNEVICTFTILTNNPNSTVVDHAIKMFGSSKHLQ